MLNEKQEFLQYTYDIDTVEPGFPAFRLQVGNLKNSGSGIYRALSIVARGFLFDDKGDRTAISISDAENIMLAWMGEKHGELPKEALGIDGWYPKYVEKLNEYKKAGDPKYKPLSENSIKKGIGHINPNSVLATALDSGPLRERYLIVEKIADPEELFDGIKAPKNNVSKSARSKALKTLALYLMETENDSSRECALINRTDLSNWVAAKWENGDIRKFVYISGESEPLFPVNNRIFKHFFIGVNKNWMEKTGCRVVDGEELDRLLAENEKLLYYADDYSNNDLRIREKYC